MRIGVPTEIKPLEFRVGLVPEVVGELIKKGHQVFIQKGAGDSSGYSDELYAAQGAAVLPSAQQLFESAELIVKVKEPVEGDLQWLRKEHLLFCFLHLAALPELTQKLVSIGLTAVAFETVSEQGYLPLLAPMSEIAGRVAVQWGGQLLYSSLGGRGLMLGGISGAERGCVTVLGAGVAGRSAASLAAAMGANVTVFDVNPKALAEAKRIGPNVTALYSNTHDIGKKLIQTDLLIGAVLLPGDSAPKIVSRDMVKSMLPGSVIVDVAVDQGGCIETTRPTNYENPTYVEEGVIHMAVTNMPGGIPRTASQALSGALLPYVAQLADQSWRSNPALRDGVNVASGKIVLPTLIHQSE
ncbi:MAG: alanine dehydrogenase [Moraxellaceae bacterium]|nr:MAG: alanine dehydrogenase [Moraxellaceae bacterium]